MRLSIILRKYRVHSELTIRELAAQIGLDPTTYCRIERGEMMSGETLGKVLRWLTDSIGDSPDAA